MFEVGKIYKYKSCHLVYKCLAVCKDQGWMQTYNDDPITMYWCSDWKEYHEPVVVKTCLSLWKRGDGSVFACHLSEEYDYSAYLKDIEVTVTDGKLTDVKIL